MKTILIAFLALFLGGQAHAKLTAPEFHQGIQDVLSAFSSEIAAQNATTKVFENWNDPDPNSGTQRNGNEWQFIFSGGIGRLPDMTPDAFVIIVCHELGHELGGYTFGPGGDAYASGGQADLFATQACARKVWLSQKTANASFRAHIATFEKSLCDRAWEQKDEQNLCYRIMSASKQAGKVISQLDGSMSAPKVETPDQTLVDTTSLDHPTAQCRLDTYVNGALCTQNWDAHQIPGDLQRMVGAATIDQERATLPFTCPSSDQPFQGARPRCWFKTEL